MVELLKVPVPLLVHCILVAWVSEAPESRNVALSQIVASAPAVTIACLENVRTIWSVTFTQGAIEVAVMLRVTLPSIKSF